MDSDSVLSSDGIIQFGDSVAIRTDAIKAMHWDGKPGPNCHLTLATDADVDVTIRGDTNIAHAIARMRQSKRWGKRDEPKAEPRPTVWP